MPALSSFEYAVIRVLPRVDREEFVNSGVIVFCLEKQFLGALVEADEKRWLTLFPNADLDSLRRHLDAFERICRGDEEAGPIGRLPKRERFHWLVSPRSTTIQTSPVHSGLCEEPETTLRQLFNQLVRVSPPAS